MTVAARDSLVEKSYELARERFASVGVDAEAALRRLAAIPLSLHCWQGDDVHGLENNGRPLEGGIAVTGNYPGRARNGDELRADLERVFALLPGTHRVNLHASYAETGGQRVDRDAVEPKLFGLGSESYVVGSHEFLLGYAVKRGKMLCLDSGHFHPTESVADKISAILCHVNGILLHVSRGVRWDSDHVVTLTDEVQAIAQELVRDDYIATGRVHLGLDYFDATINRVAAWVIGSRAMLK